MLRPLCIGAVLLLAAPAVQANPPVASYIFPAGGQRGTAVRARVGGLFLHEECGFEMLGFGVHAPARIRSVPTRWFEGPLLPLPDSQRAEDYPQDMTVEIKVAADAPVGVRYWRLSTAQGATPAMRFVVGELREVVESEIDGDAVPVPVKLPVTINGRIFPREDLDDWSFHAAKGESVLCEVNAARLGSPLDAHLTVLDAQGRVVAEGGETVGGDPRLRFVAPTAGVYRVRISDAQNQGGQAYVYRLTLTAGTHVDHFYPLGGRRGSVVPLELTGQGLPQPRVDVSLPSGPANAHMHYLAHAGGQTNGLLLDVDDLAEYLEGAPATAKPLALPAVFNGRIGQPGEVDAWAWLGHKGETVLFELRAGRLGSQLDGVLTVHDASGKELARAEAVGPAHLDPSLSFSVPADGVYSIHVQDRFRSRGGPGFAYRLRADRPDGSDFGLTLAADAITVPRKGVAKLKVTADRTRGFKAPIELQVSGMPAGVTVSATTIAAGQTSTDVTFKADDTAKIQPSHLAIRGKAQFGDRTLERVAALDVPRGQPPLSDVLLVVALPTPFVIKGEYEMGFAGRGSVQKRRYKIVRNGYEGPIDVRLADRQARHLQGVTGPTIRVPAGANEFAYPAQLPPWMETGRTCRVCVMGLGTVKEPDGSEHRVSFSSVNQNEQLVAVVGPGKLAIDLPKTSFTVRPGQPIVVAVNIKRGVGIHGSVRLELVTPAHLAGLAAIPTTIAADRTAGELTIRCDGPIAPINMPLTVRATLMHDGDPLTAETKVDVQP